VSSVRLAENAMSMLLLISGLTAVLALLAYDAIARDGRSLDRIVEKARRRSS
jgi:hypothetical protein